MISTAFHLEPIHTDQYLVMGDVVIAAGVAIAPGVLLQADTGSRIVLGMGICLGMGCVIHASGGEIRIDAGVNLGAGVLIVGATTIGPGAIVGSGTTIMGEPIGPGQIVPPNSLLATVPSTVTPPAPTIVPPTPEVPKVNTEGNGFFYSKTKAASDDVDDPWAAPKPTPVTTPVATPVEPPKPDIAPVSTGTPTPNTFVDPQGSYFSGTGFSAASDFSGTAAPGTGTPTTSTYVYPDSGYQPKHPWENNVNTDLGNSAAKATPIAPNGAPATPNPDSDLSAAEMQNDGVPPASGYLVPQTPKQVYGQAYVNQMLGRMTGKKY
jgi:carbon dioxide concentrating mechanism protein CcmN